MRNNNLLFAAVLLFTVTLSQSSFAQGRGGSRGNMGNRGNSGSAVNASSTILALPVEDLDENEIQNLLYMREEEKLARDVYRALYEKWELVVFNNIANSEQKHTDAVKVLLEKYELTDTFLEETGKFTNTDLQSLYSSLVDKGSQSLIDALYVGLTIEDLDIYDLHEALNRTNNQDITLVYNNLLKGSRNHMRAFNTQYTAQNQEYQPQYISIEEFTEIIETSIERGRGNNRGNRNSGDCINPTGPQNNSTGNNNSSIKASNYPNPANPGTTIQFALAEPANVEMKIYNVRGQLVMQYEMGYLAIGDHQQQWNGIDRYGQQVTSGIYFYEINTGSQKIVKQLSLLK